MSTAARAIRPSINPVAWRPEPNAGFTGRFSRNERLSAMTLLPLNGERGPETIIIGKDQKLYTGVLSGKILRLNPDGSGSETIASTGGRVLGLTFDGQGRLVVADSLRGLLLINSDGTCQTLIDGSTGPDSVGWFNSVTIASNGKIYATVPNTRFHPAVWGVNCVLLDVFEHSGTGMVFEFDLATGKRRVVAHGFYFTNGIELSQDEQFLFVAESAGYRVWKIAVNADQIDIKIPNPQATVLLDNLPGFPDNLKRGLDGRIWLGIPNPRIPAVDKLARRPMIRKALMGLPQSLWPAPKQYGHVLAFNENGKIVVDLQDPSGKVLTMGATETQHGLYIQSQRASAIGFLQPKLYAN